MKYIFNLLAQTSCLAHSFLIILFMVYVYYLEEQNNKMTIFSECGGKMHLREGEFERAHTDFFEAFKNYDESGSPRRTTCLKYLVLANMWVWLSILYYNYHVLYY